MRSFASHIIWFIKRTEQQKWQYFVQNVFAGTPEHGFWIMGKAVGAELEMSINFQFSALCMR